MAAGWVYLMVCGEIRTLYKIGMTRLDPQRRAEQLSAPSGVPGPFEVLVAARVRNPVQAERMLHDLYRLQRPNDKREFFWFDGRAGLLEACARIHNLPTASEWRKHEDFDWWVDHREPAGSMEES